MKNKQKKILISLFQVIVLLFLFSTLFFKDFFSLSDAAYQGQNWRIHLLLYLNKDINKINCINYAYDDNSSYSFKPCYTPLNFAIARNNITSVKTLLQSGAKTDIPSNNLPLTQTIYLENEQIFQLLLDSGAKLNNDKNTISTILYMDNIFFLKKLIKQYSLSKEELFCKTGNRYNILKYLLKNGVNPDYICKKSPYGNKKTLEEQRTKLYSVSWHDDNTKGNNSTEIAQLLIKHKADINFKDSCNNTPLHYAVKQESVHVIKVLLENNATLNIKNCKGKTAYELTKHRKWAKMAFEKYRLK